MYPLCSITQQPTVGFIAGDLGVEEHRLPVSSVHEIRQASFKDLQLQGLTRMIQSSFFKSEF